MQKNIPRDNKLLIISDTGMFKKDKHYYAFGPVVKELEIFKERFNSIVWIGYERIDNIDNKSYLKVDLTSVTMLPLKRVGGKTFFKKIEILFFYPFLFFKLFKHIYAHKYLHIRAPSHPAVVAMFYSFLFPKKTFWFKYAGNWKEKASKYYELQRFVLKHLSKNSIITVNGKWHTKNNNILAFENPCLNDKDREQGKNIILNKKLERQLVFCFVGALNEGKGVSLLINALKELKNKERIKEFHFVGGSSKLLYYKKMANDIGVKIIFHGYIEKEAINEIYAKSHFIILPSKSEGFPKVIGEAMNFGCVPIVSDISSIGQYIKHCKNGFLLKPITKNQLITILDEVFALNQKKYREMILNNYTIAEKFTYNYYLKRMNTEIFKN